MKKLFKIIIASIILLGLIVFSAIYPHSQLFGKVLDRIDTQEKIAALTFDDGPGNETAEILDILKEHNVKATFFIVGERAVMNPEIVRRIAAEGHAIGIHGVTHAALYKENEQEISGCLQILKDYTGNEIKYFRPPYGFRLPTTIIEAERLNLTTTTWSVFPRDYSLPGTEKIVSRTMRELSPGAIIALHDGPENRKQTAEAVGIIIEEAEKQGYRFVLLPE